MMISIRDAAQADETVWRRLWAGYLDFFRAAVPDAITEATWTRILDPGSPMFCRLAVSEEAAVGFAVCVLHEGTWVVRPICYLEDLFVDGAVRGQGAGRALIADLVSLGQARGWSRLYWNTDQANPARKLYDSFLPAETSVRYQIMLGAGGS